MDWLLAQTDWTAVLTAFAPHVAAIFGAVATLVIAIGTLFNTLLAWRANNKIDKNTQLTEVKGQEASASAQAAKEATEKAADKVETLSKTVNGRMDDLLRAAEERGVQRGLELAAKAAQVQEVQAVTIETPKVEVIAKEPLT